ncbi:UDP-glucuronosyltransferase 2B13-like [Lampris incognitus]|uniref:UDP-glucuronosyltransferase 2B13-like n=1 Tax=Lampris incognitus TaxID=2546036 RepID=UPI0024B4D48F|nr:UDP-glucuronosyltransferase 2B13-like [Lampris incognitus]
MNFLIKALHSQGHSITVVRTTNSWYVNEESLYYDSINIPVEGTDENFIKPIIKNLIDMERVKSFALNAQVDMFSAVYKVHMINCDIARNMLSDKSLMSTIEKSQYDLILTDPASGVGILLSHYLKLPLVYNVRWATAGEGHLVIAPSPLSFVPVTSSGLSDKMTFVQRVKNMLFYMLVYLEGSLLNALYQTVCDEYFTGVKFKDLLQSADIWLMRVDFVFEFPRPTMPNIIYIGGFQCKPAEPLPQHLEDFVLSSGKHGVIIMSLGTFVSELPTDMTNKIAAGFAKLPQKVIWRHTGAKPATLGNNTLLVDWMPQNDLLGHPKVKLIVAHGGTNGIQEAIYHGVPVLGLPLVFDQYDNLLRLKDRGAAKILSLVTVDKDNNFLEGLQEVLHEPSYRTNMQRLSRLHRDQPIKPLDHALFWIEFVMRHKGTAHLRTESYRMPWYSYYSIDVILILLATVLLITFLAFACFRNMCNKISLKTKTKKE